MKRIITTTTIALGFVLGVHGLAGAQGVNPGQQGMQPGGTTGGMSTGATAGSMAGQGQQASRMGEEQVRNALKAHGYSDISGLERDGNNFKVNEAKRYGEKVEDLRIDASTGQVRGEKRLSEDQAKTLLRERGYSDVSDVKRDGNTINAKAKQNDREVRVRVDAQTGTVTQQQASK